MRTILAAMLTSACLAWGAAALAQEGGELVDEEAKSLYQAGAIAFDQGRFQNALDSFQRAYALSKRPQLLFNIGVVSDRLRLDEQALQSFEQYLQLVPDGAEAANVRARIEVLRKTISERKQPAAAPVAPEGTQAAQPAPAPPAQTAAEPAPAAPPSASVAASDESTESSGSSLLGWTLVGGGAAVAIGGGVLLVIGQSHRGKIEDAEEGTEWADVSKYDDANTFTGLGAALLGVGVAGAVIGIVLLSSGETSEQSQATLRVGPGGLELRGRL
jgi:tetratricopeptide (TPR) repeat protein